MMKAMLAAGAAFFMLAGQAAAQQMCAPAEEYLDFLFDEYGETPVWVGAPDNGRPVVLTLSEDGTWTVLFIVGGKACLLLSGEDGVLMEGA